jgi:hypothetical protein
MIIQGHNNSGGENMKKHDNTEIPYLPTGRDFYGFAYEMNRFDPLGSYTGRTAECDEVPVQDADDL